MTGRRLGSRRVPTVGTNHVLKGLCRLDADGRLVTVLNAAVRREKPVHRSFSKAVDSGPFRLRADVEVGGAVYRPDGTSVRTRVLVVDRFEDERVRVEAVEESVADAADILAPIRIG